MPLQLSPRAEAKLRSQIQLIGGTRRERLPWGRNGDMLRNRPRPTKGLAPPACAKLYFGSQKFKAGTKGVRLVLARAPLISAAPACPHRESAAPEEQAAVKDQRNSVQHSGPAQGKK